MKISFRKIAQSLNGFSTPMFGVSWTPPRLEAEIVESLLTFLEDRRVLYNPLEMERIGHTVKSVQEIRQRLTEDLQKVDRESELAKILQAMRVECREFMNKVGPYDNDRVIRHDTNAYRVMILMAALMDLRSVFGTCIGHLSSRYGVDIEASLAAVVPEFRTAALIESAQTEEDRSEKQK